MQTAATFVERVQECFYETAVLHEVRHGPATRDQVVHRIRAWNLEGFGEDKARRAIDRLQNDGHVRIENDAVTLTDDGREDIQNVEAWYRMVADRIGHEGGSRPQTAQAAPGSPRTGGAAGSTGTGERAPPPKGGSGPSTSGGARRP